MSLLDRLLPQNYLSNVQATFRPKSYDFIQGATGEEDFLPGFGEGENIYNLYNRLKDAGINPSQEMAQRLAGEGGFGSPGNEAKRSALLSSYMYTMYKALEDAGETLTAAEKAEMEELKENYVSKYSTARSQEGQDYVDDLSLVVEDAFIAPQDAAVVNPFASGSLAEGFRQAGVSDFDADMATTAALGTLRQLDPGSYAKEISEKRGTLADRLVAQQQSAQQAGSGFAGYGGRTVGQELAQQQYEAGVQDIYSGVAQQRGQALQDLYSQLDDYGRLISQQQGE